MVRMIAKLTISTAAVALGSLCFMAIAQAQSGEPRLTGGAIFVDDEADCASLPYYRQSANAGNPSALYRLGREAESGRCGGLRDFRFAIAYYRLAARAGDSNGRKALARLQALADRTPSGQGVIPSALRPAN